MPTIESVQESAEETRQLIMSIFTDSEKACVILGGALLDTQLTKALRKILRPAEKKKFIEDELFGPDRAIGNFGAKIRLAYRLGLIDVNFLKGLKLVNLLRNDFAHLSETIHISQSPYKDWMITLRGLAQKHPTYIQVYDWLKLSKQIGAVRQVFAQVSPELKYFIASVSAMLTSLKVVTEDNNVVKLQQLASFHVIITDE